MVAISDILERIRGYAPDADLQPVMTAYLLAARAHADQTRKSGEAYLSHPLAVAHILSELRMDVDTIATALLHDALEDNPITKEEMAGEIGQTITELVDGVTKIGKLKFRSRKELAAENFRKMMLAMSKDVRVILVKLADRLHNMQTLEFHKPEKRRAIAQETREIFVPIANRLGIQRVKAELEDLCFAILEPEEYQRIDNFLVKTQADREAYTKRVCRELDSRLKESGVDCDVKGRPKARHSIHRKIIEQGLELHEVSDLLAFRVLVPDIATCYASLGLVHSVFPPVQDRIKDYIARPKRNGYKSLHTTVVGPEERRIEVQIRTYEMHRFAEEGIAAHWRYKEGHLALSPEEVLQISRVRELFELARDAENATEFMETVKVELYSDEVFVFTPRGDVKRFPLGATALDFAYAIHTDVGHTCVGAKVDGRMVPLRYELQSGDHVEVLTAKGQEPNRDWLDIAKTGRAVSKIRRHLRMAERQRGDRLGRDMVEAELKRFGWTLQRVKTEGRWKDTLKHRGYKEAEALMVDVATGRLSLQQVVRDLLPEGTYQTRHDQQQNSLQSLLNRIRPRTESPVLITGEDGLLVQFAKCCGPLPGEPVVGFITRGRGITVHKAGCDQLKGMDPERRIPVEWDRGSSARHTGEIQIVCDDRPGMLANISRVCEQAEVNIQSAEAKVLQDQRGLCTLRLSVRDISQLATLIKNIQKLKGVEEVHRTVG